MTEPFNQVSPPPVDHRRFDWDQGSFEAARRPRTALVEGRLISARPIVMVTLRGGAARHAMRTEDGHRYEGPDRAGTMSFLPAGCARHVMLEDVAWQWASLTLRPELLDDATRGGASVSFRRADDPAVLGLLAEMDRLHAAEGGLDPAYCDTMALALTHYLAGRYWRRAEPPRALKLAPWRLRRVTDYVADNLAEEIRIASLAAVAGCSEAHFHRAFRATTGETPLGFIHRQRIERAMQILATADVPITRLALELGFISPSHFARVFKAVAGRSPRAFRAAHQTH